MSAMWDRSPGAPPRPCGACKGTGLIRCTDGVSRICNLCKGKGSR